MIRKIVSIIAGYSIFVATSLAFFKISRQDPHSNPSTIFLFVTIMFGSVFSFVAGFVTQLIAKSNLKLNYMLAVIIAGFATFSLIKSEGNRWTQILAIFIFTPMSILGGLFYMNRRKKI
jgi:hypothetical protein